MSTILYNVSADITTFEGVFQQVQTVAPWAEGVVIVIFVIAFAALKSRNETIQSMTGAMVITWITTLSLVLMGLLDKSWLDISSILTALTIVILWKTQP